MKYEVKMSCGHTVTVNFYGKGEGRERFIAWLEKYGLCHECKKAEEETARNEFEASHDLPDLEGSEEQVKWARSIREKFITEIEKIPANNEEGEELKAMMIKYFADRTDSRFFIDNRDRSALNILRDAAKEGAFKK